MLKKVVSATIVLALVSSTGSISYSDVVIDKDKATNLQLTTDMRIDIKKQLEVYKPESGIISNKIVLLSGIASEGNNIIVEVYSTASISLNKGNSNNLSRYNFNSYGLNTLNFKENEINQDIYLPPVIKKIEVGVFGYFAEELKLRIGLNRINIYIEGSSDDSQSKYIYVNDYSKAENLIKRIDNMDFFNTMKQIFGKEETKELIKSNEILKEQLLEDEDEDKVQHNTENEELLNDNMEETGNMDDKEYSPKKGNTN